MKTTKTIAARAALRLLVLALALSGSGCGALDRVDAALNATGAFDLPAAGVDDACAVTVLAGYSRGRGLVVGPRTVLTVAHVVDEAAGEIEVVTSTLASSSARIVRRIHAEPEDVIVLELAPSAGPLGFTGFQPEQVGVLGDGAATWVLTQSGPRASTARLEHGDSGSPVLDAEGHAVALVVGRTSDGASVFASLRGDATSTSSESVLLSARR